jgi:hypothetical protein
MELKNNTDKQAENQETVQKSTSRFRGVRTTKLGIFLKKFISTKKRKIITISAILFSLLVVVVSIPTSRYAVLGLVIKKDITIKVIDSSLKKPVSDASVKLGGVQGKTDSSGVVILRSVSVGIYDLSINKEFYEPTVRNYAIPVIKAIDTTSVQIKAKGRQVSISVIDSIANTPIKSAKLSVDKATAITDKNGVATIVIPADKNIQKGVLEKSGYSSRAIELSSENTDKKMVFSLTSSGTLFYLSKSTGTINVMKSKLDGTSPEVVVAGTGKEKNDSTVLLAARDWKYLTLLARRDGTRDKVYVINTETGELVVADEGSASFELIGWSGHKFVYKVVRETDNQWDDKRQVLKVYDAESRKIMMIDQATGSGTSFYDYRYESIGNAYILDNEIVYTKSWDRSAYPPSDVKMSLVSSTLDGKKHVIKEVAQSLGAYVNLRLYKPQELYARFQSGDNKASYYEYESGTLKQLDTMTDDQFHSTYPTYLVSPSGKRVFWFEIRDGKNSLFIGDNNGGNSKQIAALSDFVSYGWYTDKYVLLTKNGSELYIAPVDVNLTETYQPLKVTNYHKPYLSYPGYGYGYGGQ